MTTLSHCHTHSHHAVVRTLNNKWSIWSIWSSPLSVEPWPHPSPPEPTSSLRVYGNTWRREKREERREMREERVIHALVYSVIPHTLHTRHTHTTQGVDHLLDRHEYFRPISVCHLRLSRHLQVMPFNTEGPRAVMP